MFIQARLVEAEMQILKYDVAAAQVEAAQAWVDPVLGQVEEGLKFFPTSVGRLVTECAQLGDLMTSPQEAMVTLRNRVNELTWRVREIASFSRALHAQVDRLNGLATLISETMDYIKEVLIPEKLSPPAI